MSKWIPWFILGVLSLFLLLSYHYYASGAAASATVVPEPFDAPPIHPPPSTSPFRGNLNICTVYYTSNVDICNRPLIPTITIADVDADRVNYYSIGKDEVGSNITRINAIPTATRTPQQSSALINLKRVLADIDTLPFKNTCKLEMAGLKESSAHPRKINQDYDGTDRRGNPLHWSFCYYNMANDTLPSPAPNRITPTLRASTPFQRVFQDTTVDYTHSTGAYRRFDMKSMYNDDLLNLHCALYTESLLEGGSAVSAFNNLSMMELTLVASEVAALSTATTDTRLTITRMRPVKVANGVLVVETGAAAIKSAALSLIEIIRTQTALVHRQKAYSPTLYKILFHLCSATTPATPTTPTPSAAQMVYDKYIQLMVPKPLNAPVSQIMRLKASYTASQTQIYDFYAQAPRGDISDMIFDITALDNRITV